jgi:hypothetical protein
MEPSQKIRQLSFAKDLDSRQPARHSNSVLKKWISAGEFMPARNLFCKLAPEAPVKFSTFGED